MPTSSPYERDLDRNAANYTPLTPLSLIARTAYTYPHMLAVVHGERRYTWAETYARSRRLASALDARGHRHRRHRRRDGGQHAGDGRAALRRADDRRRAQHAQHAPRRRDDRIHAAARRGEGARHRHRIRGDRREGAGADQGEAAVIDIDDPQGPGGKRLGSTDYEAFIAGGDPEFDWKHPADEWNAISLNYTSGHDRQSQGRRLPSPRRLPQRAVEHHRLGHAAAFGLPVDAADVPLQRLVLRVDDGSQRRRQRLPAPRRGEGRARRDPRCTRSRITAARRSSTEC